MLKEEHFKFANISSYCYWGCQRRKSEELFVSMFSLLTYYPCLAHHIFACSYYFYLMHSALRQREMNCVTPPAPHFSNHCQEKLGNKHSMS